VQEGQYQKLRKSEKDVHGSSFLILRRSLGIKNDGGGGGKSGLKSFQFKAAPRETSSEG